MILEEKNKTEHDNVDVDLKKMLEDGNTIVVFDTNIYLNLYRYSPDWVEFLFRCVDLIKSYIIVPQMIYIEFCKNHRALFSKREKSLEKKVEDILRQTDEQKTEMINRCNSEFQRGNFPEVDSLLQNIQVKYDEIKKELSYYFDDHSLLRIINNSWEDDKPRCLMDDLYANAQVLHGFSMDELYQLCEEGERRYERSVPPGYKDKKDKDGMRKYGDLIWWKEVLRFAKNYRKNVVLVTDDIKEDWWRIDNNNYRFREELIKEFAKETLQAAEEVNGLKLLPFVSNEFFKTLSETYEIERSDAIDLAMALTDEKYINSIESKVFYKVLDTLLYSGEEYIEDGHHIGSEGIGVWEIDDYDFQNYELIERIGNHATYKIVYDVKLSGTSNEYWGRDEDTKEVILSPDINHWVQGTVEVSVNRMVDIAINFQDDMDFENCELVAAHLQEEKYENTEEEEYCKNAYDRCPCCGKLINFENDAGNGFCIKCTNEKDEL